AVLVDKGERVVSEVVGDVTVAADHPAVVVERRAEVLAPVAGGETVVLVEPAGVRVIRVLCAIVPLAERPGCVTGRLKDLGDRPVAKVQAFAAGRDVEDAAARVVAA